MEEDTCTRCGEALTLINLGPNGAWASFPEVQRHPYSKADTQCPENTWTDGSSKAHHPSRFEVKA